MLAVGINVCQSSLLATGIRAFFQNGIKKKKDDYLTQKFLSLQGWTFEPKQLTSDIFQPIITLRFILAAYWVEEIDWILKLWFLWLKSVAQVALAGYKSSIWIEFHKAGLSHPTMPDLCETRTLSYFTKWNWRQRKYVSAVLIRQETRCFDAFRNKGNEKSKLRCTYKLVPTRFF